MQKKVVLVIPKSPQTPTDKWAAFMPKHKKSERKDDKVLMIALVLRAEYEPFN